MVSNNINRILIGLLLVTIVIFFYFTKLDLIFIFILLIFITYDFFYIKLISNYSLFSFLFITIFSLVFISYNQFDKLFFIQTVMIGGIFFLKNYRSLFFVISLYIFILILFYLVSLDRNIFYLLIFISFFNDTIAYLAGRLIGGQKIAPHISPKKTWSGTTVSFIATTTLIFYLNYSILISMVLSISLFIGDIFFSYIKRILHLKDFSSLLKSHGGLLDRLDSMFFFAMIIQIYLVYIK